MKMLLTVLLMLASLHSFAQDNNIINGLYQVIFDHPSCISGIQENRIYFQSDQIFPTEKGLFLKLHEGEDFVQLQHLYSDQFGCYINLPREKLDEIREILNKCPHCGQRYYAYCKNPECFSNKKRK